MTLRLALLSPLLPLAACAEPVVVDDGLVTWSGYVYTGPQADVAYTDGGVTFTADDADPVDATAPYSDYPAYWSVDVPPSTAMTIHVDSVPRATWRVVSPATGASWYSGALFGADAAEIDSILAALGAPERTTAAMVIGNHWDDGWDCADVRVADEPPLCFAVDDDGVVTAVDSGDFSYFVAPSVPAGAVVVDSGLGGTATYDLEDGDVGMAFWFVGNEQ